MLSDASYRSALYCSLYNILGSFSSRLAPLTVLAGLPARILFSVRKVKNLRIAASFRTLVTPVMRPAARYWVAYLSPADNVLRPLLCCLREVSQPVMSPPNPFSTPRLPRLACLGAHRAALHPHAQPVSCFRPSAAEAMAAPGTIVPL